jgi:iron complex outermembrane recepter protein
MTHRKNRIASPPSRCAGIPALMAPWFALTMVAAAVGNAYGQTAPAPAGAASAPQPAAEKKAAEAAPTQTITVSATRRRELISEVPLAISSIATDRLEEVGAKTLNDYLASQPGVILQNANVGDSLGNIVIRGLTAGIDSNSPTTVYIDDTPLAPGVPFDFSLLDLSRFEILRGPQGTLYGSSAMGGVVKYITVEPDTAELSGKVRFGLSQTRNGDGMNKVGSAVVNVPLQKDFAALRVAAFGSQDAGWVNATGRVNQDGVNKKEARGGRFSLLVTPTRALSFKLTALTQTTESDGGSRVVYDFTTKAPQSGDLTYTLLSIAEPRKDKRDVYSATVEYDMGWARLSSITSSQKSSDNLTTDFGSLAAAFALETAKSDSTEKGKQTSQEFRLVSQTGGAFDWLAGVFFIKNKQESGEVLTGGIGGVSIPFGETGGVRDYKETAVYGNVTWNATPELALTGGLRLAKTDQEDLIRQTGAPNKVISFSESPKTYLLTAKYRLSAQSNVYTRAASGYRPGGANFSAVDINNQPIPGAPDSYKTDSVWTYEAGWKASFPDSRSSIEVAVFNTDWKDIQQFTQGPIGGFTTNLGKARIRGIEASGTLRPISALSLAAAVSLMEPKLLTDSPGLGGSAGDRLPNSPKVAVNLSSRYTFDLAGNAAFAAINLAYQGDRNSSFPNSPLSPNFVLPAYTRVDLAGGVTLGAFDIGLYVRNLTDKRGLMGASTGESLQPGGRTYVQVITPRTVGINLTAAF